MNTAPHPRPNPPRPGKIAVCQIENAEELGEAILSTGNHLPYPVIRDLRKLGRDERRSNKKTK